MNRLKQLRNSRGITQDELGRMLGVQKAAICKYENGRVNMPNSVIMRLVEIFQVSADYLLGTDEVVPLLKSRFGKTFFLFKAAYARNRCSLGWVCSRRFADACG